MVYEVQSNVQETEDIFTLTLKAREKTPLSFMPGQFNMLYQFGIGEIPISISSNPSNTEVLLHTIRAVGPVTNSMQKLQKGDTIGVRGPFGNAWPLSEIGCDVLIIAGGVGLAPLRAALYHLAAHQEQYKKITILYGAKTPSEIMYKKDLQFWKQKGLNIEISVDRNDGSWTGPVGVITSLINKHVSNPFNTLALVCGPEIMMHFASLELLKVNVQEERIYLSMERNMQCGTGFCGHCQYGPYFVCKDGPIFAYPKIKKWLAIKEL